MNLAEEQDTSMSVDVEIEKTKKLYPDLGQVIPTAPPNIYQEPEEQSHIKRAPITAGGSTGGANNRSNELTSSLPAGLARTTLPPLPSVAPTTPQQQVALPQQQVALPQQAPEVTQPSLQSSRRAQELINRYKAKQTPQVSQTATPQVTSGVALPTGGGVPTIQEYVKRGATRSGKKGAGIKEIL